MLEYIEEVSFIMVVLFMYVSNPVPKISLFLHYLYVDNVMSIHNEF